ncbi:MAG: PEGA domain-containing protein [Deltaproteobacteria bacterium]|nr:PEGA domain-containing protein [Deltaproteobacteria bacterium]
MIRAFCVLLGALVGLLPAMQAHARSKSRKERVLILRVESTQVPDAERRSLTDALAESAKRYKHYDIIVSKSDLVEEMFEFECTEAGVDCLEKLGKKYKVDRVVYSEVAKGSDGKLEWSMRVVGLKPVARVEQSTRQPLEGHDIQKVTERGLLVLIGPVDLPERGGTPTGTLMVRLAGGGVALVYVNEKLLGRTSVGGLTAPLPPGTYRLRVVRAGYKEFSTVVRVASEKSTELAVTLELAPAPTKPPPGAPSEDGGVTSKWYFWAGIGAVVVGGAVAAYLLTRGDDAPSVGNASFSFDSDDAHLDPVFAGK